jgi:cell division protein FtsB
VIAGRGVSDGGATGYDLGGVGEGVTVESLQRQVVAERERADALDKRRQEQVDNQVKIIDRLKAENLAMEAEIRRLKSLGGNGTW